MLPPNPGIALGSAQFTVAIHDDRPLEMEWRSPETNSLERRRIIAGEIHIKPADRPVFQRWSGRPAILLIALQTEFMRQVEEDLFEAETGYVPTLIGVRDATIATIGEAWREELAFQRSPPLVPPPSGFRQADLGIAPERQSLLLAEISVFEAPQHGPVRMDFDKQTSII
jgi:hypothetical protein